MGRSRPGSSTRSCCPLAGRARARTELPKESRCYMAHSEIRSPSRPRSRERPPCSPLHTQERGEARTPGLVEANVARPSAELVGVASVAGLSFASDAPVVFPVEPWLADPPT
eukprot:767471-Hanusia_phi.AAC.1